ncbi:MAG: hydroxyacylglutathione hydrolase [Aquisalimonadaceae bacterium]
MINVFPISAFSDNYIWAIQREGTNHCAVVDPGDAAPVLSTLAARNLRLDAIIITHHHADHVGGVEQLLRHFEVPVYGPAGERIPGRTTALNDGDSFHLPTLGLDLEVIDVPGHTAGHIAYYGHDLLFCGDTLFAGGCGRLFEGTPAQMHASLSRLAALPDTTQVFCAHEYTQANLRFARRVDPENEALAQRLRTVEEKRAAGECTLPSRIGTEKQTNPFLRSDDANVKQAAERLTGKRLTSAVDVFTAVRALKDAG